MDGEGLTMFKNGSTIEIQMFQRCCVGLDRLARSRAGATAIEYGLIAALVSIAGIAAFNFLGLAVSDIFGMISGDIEAVVPMERCVEVESNCNK